MNLDFLKERVGNTTKKYSEDIRNEYQRDFARIVHSAAFRRLQSKTQVLGLGDSDFYRTRLTHSMEVSQIGVGINQFLKNLHKRSKKISRALPDDFLMRAICLSHDVGHPPFGHGGEVALNYCMKEFGGFEGNAQTLRILAKLEKYTKNNGMDVTRRTLLGILKYPSTYSSLVKSNIETEDILSIPANSYKPPKCYYDCDRDIVDWVLNKFNQKDKEEFIRNNNHGADKHSKTLYKSLDTSIMELADDISYGVHDLEDAIALGMINKDIWNKFIRELNKTKILEFVEWFDIAEARKKLFNDNSYIRKNYIGKLVHHFITSIKVIDKNKVFESSILKYNAVMDHNSRILLDSLQKIVVDVVIKDSNVQMLEYKGQVIVKKLFDILYSDPKRLLPTSTLKLYSSAKVDTSKARVICDYISGMTDEYAMKIYEKLKLPRMGSVFDKV